MLSPVLKILIWLVLAALVVFLGILLHKFPKSRAALALVYLISGATLLCYPAILYACIMGFWALKATDITLGTVMILLFFAIVLLQPITYIACLVISKKRQRARKSITTVSLLPFIAPGLVATVVLLI